MWIGKEHLLTLLGRYLITDHNPEQADLIVVLGGDFWGPRVKKGAELVEAGYAPLVLVSGPLYSNPAIRPQPEGDLAIDMLVREGHRRELFESFLIQGKSTIDEVIEIGPVLRRKGARRILLVTSAYHSRRACVVFHLFQPRIQCRCIPAPGGEFEPEQWWRNTRYQDIFRSEWTKILGTVLVSYPRYLLRLR